MLDIDGYWARALRGMSGRIPSGVTASVTGVDEAAARSVLEPFVAGQRLPPFGRPSAGMASVARKLRLVSASRQLLVEANRSAAVVHRVAEFGEQIEDQPNDVAVIVRGGWLRMNRVVLTADLTGSGNSGTQVLHLRAAAFEGWISQKAGEKVLRNVEVDLGSLRH